MRVFRFVALLSASGLALAGCSRGRANFTILHVSDLSTIEPVEGGRAGGLARLAAFRSRLLKTSLPVLTTLGGAYLAPTALDTAPVGGQPLAGRQMVDVLNAVGLDWAAPGSRAFDLPEAVFHQRLAEQRFQLVSSNVTDVNGYIFDGTVRSAVLPIHTRARDLRIGLIGLTAATNARPWVKYRPPIEAARAEIARIRSAGPVDAILALTDLPLADDEALAAAVGDIDLVLGGRDRGNRVLRGGPRFTPIVRPDANARSAAVVTLTFDRGDGRPSVVVRLQPLDAGIAPDPAIQALADDWRARAFDGFRSEGFQPDAVAAVLPEPMDARDASVRVGPGPLADLIAAALQREARGADVTLFEAGFDRVRRRPAEGSGDAVRRHPPAAVRSSRDQSCARR